MTTPSTPGDDETSDATLPVKYELSESYHVVALRHIVREALERHRHLLDEDDVVISETICETLSNNAIYLFARLYRRKHDQWLPQRALIEDYSTAMSTSIAVTAAIDELVKHNILLSTSSDTDMHATASVLLRTLPLEQLKRLWRMVPGGLKQTAKGALCTALNDLLSTFTSQATESPCKKPRQDKRRTSFRQGTLTSVPPATRIARAIVKTVGAAMRLSDKTLLTLERLHFLVLLEDGAHLSSNFILSFTKKVQLPQYECVRTTHVFPSKTALAAYEVARELERQLEDALEKKLPETGSAPPTRDWRLAAALGGLADGYVRDYLKLPPTSNDVPDVTHERVEQCREELQGQLAHPFFRRYTAHWVYTRITWHSVAALEALGDYEAAVERLELLLVTQLLAKRRGKILDRLTIDLFRNLKRKEEALEHIVKALDGAKDSLHIGDRMELAKRGVNIHRDICLAEALDNVGKGTKAWRLEQARKTMGASVPEQIRRTLELLDKDIPKQEFFRMPVDTKKRARSWDAAGKNGGGEGMRRGTRVTYESLMGDGVIVHVEELALEFYRARGGWEGRHDEGGGLRFLFALLLWECALFSSVPDVFQSAFQYRPMDLHTEAFYVSRKDAIDKRVEQVGSMSGAELEEEVRTLYERYEGTNAVGCHWKSYEGDELACVAGGLGGRSVARICTLLATDYNYWSGGIADLVLWRRDDDGKAHAKMVEVKSQRDRISSGQRAWFSELLAMGVDCEEFRVVEKESKSCIRAEDLNEKRREDVDSATIVDLTSDD